MEDKSIIALEIGSSKIKGAIGTVSADGILSVKAIEEEHCSDIVRHGCIRNVVETASAVRGVLDRLEQRVAPKRIEGVYLSIGGRSLMAENVDIERRFASETEITHAIIQDITEEALNRPMADRFVVQALPKELRVDNTATNRPVGMYCQQISARLSLVSCRNQLAKNLTEVISQRLGLRIEGLYVRPLAVADTILSAEEKRLGCMLVDFGAETTTVAIYRGGVLAHLAVIPMGGRNITRDITALNFLEERAEEIKLAYGDARPGMEKGGGRTSEGTEISAINCYVSSRAIEILLNVVEQIKYAGLTPSQLPKGIVVVGRAARLGGLTERLQQMTGLNVRIGVPDSEVRILDGRIQSSDAVDIIAIMSEAKAAGAHECLVVPAHILREEERRRAEEEAAARAAEEAAAEEARRAEEARKAETEAARQAEMAREAEAARRQGQPATQGGHYVHPYAGNNRPVETDTQNGYNPNPAVRASGSRPAAVTPPSVAEQPKPRSKGWYEKLRDRVAGAIANTIYEDPDDE